MKRYLIQTFGCQMNMHDSRRIEEVLGAHGYSATDEAELADLILVNTCSVREKAEHKLMSLLGTLRPLKDARPGVLLAVAGCVAQQEGERLLRKAPYVDVVIGPDNIPELPSLVRAAEGGAPPAVRTVFDMDTPSFLHATPRGLGREVTAFVTVMKGCDERCTYCVVPHTRGPERYRAAGDIVDEVARLVDGGVREVTLLGQTVNSWYEPGEGQRSRLEASRSAFPALLRRIAREVPGLARLRYTSPHPRHLTDALVAAHAELDVLPRHVHLPAQSGSDAVLRRMSRRYTATEYLDRVGRLRGACPGLTLSTDLIVGFPGETDADFEATLALVRSAGVVSAFCFMYSPRPNTPALVFGDDVPDEVKQARLARLFEVTEAQQAAHLASLVGSEQEVLVERRSAGRDASPAHARFTGRSGRHELVHFDAAPGLDPIGQLVRVTITEAYGHSLGAQARDLEGQAAGFVARSAPARPRPVRLPVVTGGSA